MLLGDRICNCLVNTVHGARSDTPLIQIESNNPAILIEKAKVKMVFRDAALHIYLAEGDNYKGPYIIKNDNVWPDNKLEDFYLFKANNQISHYFVKIIPEV